MPIKKDTKYIVWSVIVIIFLIILKLYLPMPLEPLDYEIGVENGSEIRIKNNMDRAIRFKIEAQLYSESLGINETGILRVVVPAHVRNNWKFDIFTTNADCNPQNCLTTIINYTVS